MLIITKELQEFLYELGRMLRLMSEPKNWVPIILMGIGLVTIYFSAIILADIIKIF